MYVYTNIHIRFYVCMYVRMQLDELSRGDLQSKKQKNGDVYT